MTEQDFVRLVRLNPVTAAILDRLPELEAVAQGVHLVACALFGTVWNVLTGQPPTAQIRDDDLFSWHPDPSYGAEDAVIRHTATLFADLDAPIQIRNQARVHLWFAEKHVLHRPPLRSVHHGIDQFLVRCTSVGLDARGRLHAPFGLDELEAGHLRPNPRNHTPQLYAAKVADDRRRWPWLTDGA